MYRKLIIFVVILWAAQSVANAAVTAPPLKDYKNNDFKFTPANNVLVDYIPGPGGSGIGLNQNFSIISKNTNGNRVFATSNNTTLIWYVENDILKGVELSNGMDLKQTDDTAATYPTTAGESTFSGWKGL